MSKITNFARSPGRPRNNKVGLIVLAAARKLVLQHGCSAVSIQMIATEAVHQDASGRGTAVHKSMGGSCRYSQQQ